jgi:hypothetical protein
MAGDGGTGWRRPERMDLPTGAVPFEEHVPHTVSELGLELDSRRDRRPLVVGAVAAVAVVAALAFVLLRGDSTTIADLAPLDCYSPAVDDVDAAVSRHGCDDRHGAQLVGLFGADPAADGSYPGASELALFGEAACRTTAEDQAGRSLDDLADDGIVLRIAVPDEQTWDGGDHSVACSFVRTGTRDLTTPIG